jgi:hypothetical protein
MKNVFLLNLMLVILLAACSPPSATPTETLAPTNTPTVTQTQPTPTKAKPTATPTLPTPTRRPTLTPTVTETLPPPRDPSLVVAYIKEGEVCIWYEGIGHQCLNKTNRVLRLRLSQDGKWIAYNRLASSSEYEEELWAVKTDGSDPILLIGAEEMKNFTPPVFIEEYRQDTPSYIQQYDFIPGSHTITFTTGTYWEDIGDPLYYLDLHKINLDTMEKKTILNTGEGGSIFSYSPDGSHIAFLTNDELFLIHADGSNRQKVLTFQRFNFHYWEPPYRPEFVWSRDSRSFTIIIPSWELLNDEDVYTTRAFRITASGYSYLLLEYTGIPFWEDGRISPDSTRILYCANSDYRYCGTIHEAALDGSYDIVVANGSFIGWAPDSRHFVYWDENVSNLWYGMSGEDFIKLPGRVSIHSEGFRWVDEDRYLYVHKAPDNYELRLDDISGNSILVDISKSKTFESIAVTHIQK